MANPQIVALTKDTWVKVADNVLTGMIWDLTQKNTRVLQTIRMTGQSAPTTSAEGVPIFINENSIPISTDANIDVYLMSIGEDSEVRVDI